MLMNEEKILLSVSPFEEPAAEGKESTNPDAETLVEEEVAPVWSEGSKETTFTLADDVFFVACFVAKI